MFRLQPGNLPEDPKYPAVLRKLGFFINNKGQFRMIDYPDRDFNFHYSNNDRHNEVRREAFQICQREEVAKRLFALGLHKLYLPQLTYKPPKDEASVPILAPPAEVLKTRKRVIVIINDALQDLGILAYRRLQRELGVNGGSVINFAKEVISRSTVKNDDDSDLFKDGAGVSDPAKETPGLIVMNCGQLLYSYKEGKAMTVRSWASMPRKSANYDPIQITDDNHIARNYDSRDHIEFVIENVIHNKDFVAEDAEVYVIAIENGAEYTFSVLEKDLQKYGARITAMAVINPYIVGSQVSNPHLKAFLHQRTRQWLVNAISNNPRDCIGAPSQYPEEVEIFDSAVPDQAGKSAKPVSWLETVSPGSILSKVTGFLKQLAISVPPQHDTVPEALDDNHYIEPICPTFADAENLMKAGECVFTDPSVQHAILDFFEEVAQNPDSYRNPVFKIVPGATAAAQDEEDLDAAFQPPQSQDMQPEQAELNILKAELETMKAALCDIPAGKSELQAGREGLEQRIVKTEEEVEAISRKVLAMGGMKAGEAEELRDEAKDQWQTVGGGPKIKFAGTMVDSELVKGAGMTEIAEEELAALDEA